MVVWFIARAIFGRAHKEGGVILLDKEIKTQGETGARSNILLVVLAAVLLFLTIALCSIPFVLNIHSSLVMDAECDEILAAGGFDSFNGRPALFSGDKYAPAGEKFVAHCEKRWAKQ